MANKKTDVQKAEAKVKKLTGVFDAADKDLEAAKTAQTNDNNDTTAAATQTAEVAWNKAAKDVENAEAELEAAKEAADEKPLPDFTAKISLLCGNHGTITPGGEITAKMLPGGADQLKALVDEKKVEDNRKK